MRMSGHAGFFVAAVLAAGAVQAGEMVAQVVSSPLSAVGTVRDARTGINIYLQNDAAPGIDFMDPAVIGYGIAPGGRLEIELVSGFERDPERSLEEVDMCCAAMVLVGGAPQQGLPGGAVGYTVAEGDNPNTFVVSPTGDEGLPAEKLMSGAPGAKQDPIRNRGVKVIHVGLTSAFFNRGDGGEVEVRLFDGDGEAVAQGRGGIVFLPQPVAQIHPNNLADGRRNHNWQHLSAGEVLGHKPGSVPLTFMLYAKAPGPEPFKEGIVGVGVLSTQQLVAMEYSKPEALARYNGGLIIQDTTGDGRVDPADDLIIGGIIGKAPKGARGQEARSLVRDGVATLSRPLGAFSAGAGKALGGAIMQVEFTGGDKPGLYRPTFALMADPSDPARGDGALFTSTIVVD